MIIKEYTLENEKLTRDYRIALLSDFHNTAYKKILESLPKNLDCILLPGDFCIRYLKGNRDRVVPFLKELCKIAPCYCSLGNHDKDCMSEREFRSLIQAGGAIPLLDEAVDFADLHIAGWYYKKEAPPAQLLYNEGKYNILLSHKPEWYFKHLQNSSFELIVSGHAHGGQWNLFGQPIFSSGQGLFPKYVKGLHDGRLLITTGVSNPVLIPRIGNPKEIVLILLKAI